MKAVSDKQRAKLAAAGITHPYSTLTTRSTLARKDGPTRTACLDRKPQVKVSRPADTGPTPETVAVVGERDQGCCVRCGKPLRGDRGFAWSVQHRRARQGRDLRPDTNQPHNLILLCGSATTLCHGWVESNRNAARAHGWAIRQTDDPAARFVDHAIHGRVWLLSDGGISHRAPELAA
ncbi:hypothetical protein ABZ671_00515 [Micromonospora sp. NPDC006766]|uniref:hypothetical protein n=1 Tax=Micromonospora sp. NPDC006766 TaxID=3154778 RepID=UPI0033E22201